MYWQSEGVLSLVQVFFFEKLLLLAKEVLSHWEIELRLMMVHSGGIALSLLTRSEAKMTTCLTTT